MKLCALPVIAALSLLGACADSSAVPMVTTRTTPAAQGSVTVHPDSNGNTRLGVEVKHLARPEAVWPPARVYVVWVEPAGGPPQNVGTLRIDDALTGRLETATPFQAFAVHVTAEESPAARSPRGPTALSATISE